VQIIEEERLTPTGGWKGRCKQTQGTESDIVVCVVAPVFAFLGNTAKVVHRIVPEDVREEQAHLVEVAKAQPLDRLLLP
jgi:predicted cupin superfamily sugar epimerase